MSWEAPLLALLSFSLGVFAYWMQKRFDRQEQIRARHFAVYVEMQEAICELANALHRGDEERSETLSRYATAKMKFAVVASDETVKKLVAFDQRLLSAEIVSNHEFDELLASFMKAIREENLGKTAVSNEDLITITPFGRSLYRKKSFGQDE